MKIIEKNTRIVKLKDAKPGDVLLGLTSGHYYIKTDCNDNEMFEFVNLYTGATMTRSGNTEFKLCSDACMTV